MSGGVDSSVAAIILKREGYDVIGLFMRNWDSNVNGDFLGNPNDPNEICPQEQDYNDALKVCKQLDIPLPVNEIASSIFVTLGKKYEA